jgi:hypothetical protein
MPSRASDSQRPTLRTSPAVPMLVANTQPSSTQREPAASRSRRCAWRWPFSASTALGADGVVRGLELFPALPDDMGGMVLGPTTLELPPLPAGVLEAMAAHILTVVEAPAGL